MQNNIHQNLRLSGEWRRQNQDIREAKEQLLIALGVRKPKPVYERAVEWLLAVLIEKPVRHVVDAAFDRLDRWRRRRQNP